MAGITKSHIQLGDSAIATQAIEGFEEYYVSSNGEIISTKRNAIHTNYKAGV